jgi:membrane protein
MAVALMIGLLVLLFAGLVVASVGQDQFANHAPGIASNAEVAYALSVLASALASLVFLGVTYYLLTNVPHTVRDVLPGAFVGTIVLCVTFQVLPIYLDLAQGSPALQAFGGPVILLVWLYLMANVIVFGAEINWWVARRRVRSIVPG